MAYSLTSGTASAGSDFDSSTGPVNIAADVVTGSITVPVNGDQTFESDENFTINLLPSTTLNAFTATDTAQGTILNDDPLPAITINDGSVVEGNAGTRGLVFNVTLTNPSANPISFTATTSDDTAVAGTDYVSRSSTVNILPGQVAGTFSVIVNGDTQIEPNESLFVNLTSPNNASIARVQATGTIVDDDLAALLVDESQRAIALGSVFFVRDPFTIANTLNFSSDNRTRIILFAVNLNLAQGDVVTVQAEDAQHVNHQLAVEFVGSVPNFGGVSQIVVKLPDDLGSGNFMVSFTLRGVTSNKGITTIAP